MQIIQALLVTWCLVGGHCALTSATETLRHQPSRRLQGGGGGDKNDGGDKRPPDGGGEDGSGEDGSLLDTIEDVVGDPNNFSKAEAEEIKKRVKKVMFGTKNGYDTGGTDPLCYVSPFSKTNTTSMMSTIHNEIEMLNEQLFEMADSTNLLPECPPGTSMTVTPRNLNPKTMEMLLGKPYDFLVDLTFDTSDLPSNIDLDSTTTDMSVYYRLHVCDAVRQGFCNVVRDTRDKDANLTRAEADLDDATEFPDDESKWAYTEGTALQGLLESKNDTSTMYGRWCKWKLRQQPGTGVFNSRLNVKLQLPEDNEDEMMQFGARPYFFIAQAVIHFDMKNGENGLRFDISQAIPSKVVYVKPQPTIMTVTRSAKVALGIAIGLFSLFALVCFGVIVKNREHSVMRLAQGNFLATMVAACLMVTVFSFTYLPTRDVHCRLSGPLVYIPLTLVGAILVGRVWRIYSTLSNVNKLGSHQANGKPWAEVGLVRCLDFLAGVLVCFGRFSEKYRHSKNSFRRVVTPEETSGLIALLTIPQVVLQILGSTAFGLGLETQLSDLGNSGRIVCADDNSWIFMAGTGYASFVFILAVLMAWFSRELPSAFNEKDQIFNAATIATIITAMSIGLAQVIDQPTTSPDALVMLQSCASIGIAASVLILIIWPKVSRVLSGEKVVVSKMLGSRYSMKRSSTEIQIESEILQAEPVNTAPETQRTGSPSTGLRKRIQIREDDAMPTTIETQIFELQALLRCAMNKSGDGRTLSEAEWKQLRLDVGKLKTDLDMVEVGSEIPESAPSIA